MNLKSHIVRVLLRLYPRNWRIEYGEELEALLLLRPITVSVFADVALSASRERLRSDEPWKICGIFLLVWTILGITANSMLAPLPTLSYQLYTTVWHLIVFLAALWTTLRTSTGSALWAAIRTALLGYSPEAIALFLWAAGIFHPIVTGPSGPHHLFESRLAFFARSFPTPPPAHYIDVPIAVALVLLTACLVGFAGGLLGRIILYFAPRFRPPAQTALQ